MNARATLSAPARERIAGSRTPEHPQPGMAPLSVQRVLASSGQLLESALGRSMESRFSCDFSQVRIHADPPAAASARDVDAAAYTVGRHIVFGAGGYRPESAPGRALLAHELAHVVQQAPFAARAEASTAILVGDPRSEAEARADRLAIEPAQHEAETLGRPTLQRRPLGDELHGLFAGETFPDAALRAYLREIGRTGKIQGDTDSDNKARAIVRAWSAKKAGFTLSGKQKMLLVKEMSSGFVSEGDETAILTLLTGSSAADLSTIFGSGGILPERLQKEFGPDARHKLDHFFDTRFAGGLPAVKKGTLVPIAPPPEHITDPAALDHVPRVISTLTDEVREQTAGIEDSTERAEREAALAREFGLGLAADVRKLKGPKQQGAFDQLERQQISFDDHAIRPKEDRDLELDGLESRLDKEQRQAARTPHTKSREAAARAEQKRADHRIRVIQLEAEVTTAIEDLMTQIALEALYRDPERSSKKTVEAAAKKRLSPKKAEAARDILDPDIPETESAPDHPASAPSKPVAAGSTGGAHDDADAAPKKPRRTFADKDKDKYLRRLSARAAHLVNESHKAYVHHTEQEHADPARTFALSDIEPLAQASANEVRLVFPYARRLTLTADEIDASGAITDEGTLHDAWASAEADVREGGSARKKQIARNTMFYLLTNDDEIQGINDDLAARPHFDLHHSPLNAEATTMSNVVDSLLANAKTVQRLFEIEREWDAHEKDREVFIQLFKPEHAKSERAARWALFLTIIHEYLHAVASTNYNTYAKSLGGEKTAQGNALIEGVDSLLDEVVWTSARPRARLTDVRRKVEPDAVKKGLPFDESLLPDIHAERYASYDRAMKLAHIVGIQNLYAAYFLGKVEAIGGP